MVRHAHQLIGIELREVLLEELRRVDRHEERMRPLRRRRPAMEGGVELKELFVRETRKLSRELEIDLLADVYFRKVGLIRDGAELDAERSRVRDEPLHGEKLRHVSGGFPREFQIPEGDALALRYIARHSPGHAVLAAVVAGYGEEPVAIELIVHELQIVECRAGGLHHIAPTVVPPVLWQPEPAAGVRDELPEARGPRHRIGIGLEGALDHREECNLHRHAAPFDLFGDVVHVERRPTEHPIEVLGVALVPGELHIDRPLLFLGKLKARPDPIHQIIESLAIRRIRRLGLDERRGGGNDHPRVGRRRAFGRYVHRVRRGGEGLRGGERTLGTGGDFRRNQRGTGAEQERAQQGTGEPSGGVLHWARI